MQLSLNPVFDSYLVVAVLTALLLAVIAWTYPQRLAGVALPWRRLLFGLRMAVVLLALLAMLRPALVFTETKEQSASLLVLVDRSRSMLIRDAWDDQTRWEALRATLRSAYTALDALGEELDIQWYGFSADVVEGAQLDEPPDGQQTAIGAGLDDVLRKNAGKRIAAVVLLSDGAQRSAVGRDMAPRAAAQRLRELQVPLYTVGFGSEAVAENARDLAVRNLQANPTVFVKNRLVVSAELLQRGFAREPLTTKLLFETEPGEMEVVDARTVESADPEAARRIELEHVPLVPGERKVTVLAEPQHGELVSSNNTLSTFITVRKGGLSVLYLEGRFRWEQKYVRWALDGSPDIQVDFYALRAPLGGRRIAERRDWFAPGVYDVFVIGNVDATRFEPAELAALRRAVEERAAGLIMIGGHLSFGPGGYADTPLADVLPVELDPLARQLDNVREDMHFNRPLRMIPTDTGLRHFVMRLAPDAANRDAWDGLAELEGANRLGRPKPVAQVLAKAPNEAPLLVAQDVGAGRTMAFAGDTTRQWWLHGQQEQHKRFWRQVILWLAHKEDATEGRVWLELAKRRFSRDEKVDITAGAEGPEGDAVEDATFEVVVEGPDDRKDPVEMRLLGGRMHGSYFSADTPGDYRVQLTASHDGKLLGTAQARFLVYEEDLELENPAADISLLESLAAATGGEHLRPEQLPTFLDELLSKPLNLDVEKYVEIRLWDRWSFLLLYVAVLGAEWFVRKRLGLV